MKKFILPLLLIVSFTQISNAQTFSEIIKAVASDRAANDFFGYSVSISGDYAIVGAPYEDQDAAGGNTASAAGSAYIFKNDGADNWTEIEKIVASDRAGNDLFGRSVSISGDYAIVGAPYEDEDAAGGNNASIAGSAYIFKNDGADNWTEIEKIVASDRAADDQFGYSVSISGDYVIVGAYGEDEDAAGGNNASIAGSAYIFKNDGADNWGQIQKIVASDRASGDYFGRSVSISGDYAIVGAPYEDEDAAGGNNATNAGSAYIFKNDGADNWTQIEKIVASDRGAANDFFGWSVSISGDYAIVGAYREDEDAAGVNNALSAGSAYIFKSSVPLPVELSYFKGENTTAGNLLTWQTASEESNEGFGIQRSADGKNWETIHFAAGNGTTLETQNYTFTDDAPLAGVNYYRLKQVDFDGQFEYSNIVNIQTIESSKHQNINIYPNPVTDELTIENGQGTAIIYNAVGQSVQEANIDASKVQLKVSELPQSIYTIHIRKTNGESITKQFVK
jgi:hypothetical protein